VRFYPAFAACSAHTACSAFTARTAQEHVGLIRSSSSHSLSLEAGGGAQNRALREPPSDADFVPFLAATVGQSSVGRRSRTDRGEALPASAHAGSCDP
jgi:hypothetical protein